MDPTALLAHFASTPEYCQNCKQLAFVIKIEERNIVPELHWGFSRDLCSTVVAGDIGVCKRKTAVKYISVVEQQGG